MSARKRLLDRPELWPENAEYFEAFQQLSSTRPAGMGLNCISFAEMAAYLELFPTDDVATFVRRVLAADAVFCDWVRKRQDAIKGNRRG